MLSNEEFQKRLNAVKKKDLTTAEGLAEYAKGLGLENEVNKILDTEPPKLSFLQRLGKGLGAFNPAEAILTGTEEGLGKGVKRYVSGIVKGVGSAITGRDIEGERRYFSDVAEKMGIENGIAKFGVGFLGDVLLDPTTYFGGAIARGLGIGVKTAGKVGVGAISKVAPETGLALTKVGEGLSDALGSLFKAGYKTQEGVVGDVMSFLGKESGAVKGLAESNLARLGTNILTPEQNAEIFARLAGGKRLEYSARQEFFGRIEDIGKELKTTLKNLERTYIADKKVLPIIKSVENQIDLLSGKEVEKLTEFFQEGEKITKGIPERTIIKGAGKLPEHLRIIGEKTKPFKTFDDLMKSDVGIELEKLYQEGVLERSGFKDAIFTKGGKEIKTTGLKQFFNFIKKPFKFKPEKIIEKTAKGDLTQIIKLQKDLEYLSTKSKNLREIDKKSIDDAYRFFEQKIADLTEKRQNIFENVYKQSGEKATAEVLKEATGTVKQTLEKQIGRTAKFGEELVGDEFYRSYFPFIRKDKLDRFIYETRSLRVGSQPYLKQFKNLLTNENMEQNVAKAFFNRESQVVADRMTKDFLQGFSQKYGKELTAFKTADEARNAGYELLREKGIWGKEIGYIPKWDMKFIQDMFSPEFKSIDMLAKATGFDAITSLFKRSVTGLFAPFHIRNFVSGNIQNFEVLGKDALLPQNIASGQKLAYNTIKGIKSSGEYGKQLNAFVDRFKFSSFYKNEFDNALNAGQTLESFEKVFSKTALKKTITTAGLSSETTLFKGARAIGNYIELQQKGTAYITALGQGKTIKQALDIVEKAGFDYRVLTKFESQILRRIVPFYSFTRKNIELQLRTLGENPQRINQIIRLVENIGEKPTEEERKGLPEYIKEGFAIKLPDTAEGLKQYITSFGTPIEQFVGLFKGKNVLSAISQMNPILKVPIEIGIGKDTFRQKDLKDVYDAKEYKIAPQILKDLLNIHEVVKPIYKKNEFGKLVKTGERTEYVSDPNKLLIARSLFTSRGVSYLDQIFGGDLKGFIKFLKLFTGLKPQQLDLEITKALKDKEQRRALEDLLIKMGKLKEYRTTYEPK